LATFEKKTISVGKLMLDTANPRHEEVASQKEAITALIESERQKLVVLANDILENGASPIDRLLVVKDGRNYIVVEGNRRLAVVRILKNPVLAEGTSIESQMKRLAAKGLPLPTEFDCAVAPSRKEARHWMVLRHGGESEGAGVVPWNAMAANRFAKPGREAGAAIRFLEEVERAYPKNQVIQQLIGEVARKRLTTLGRLVLDPGFQEKAGMAVDGNGSLAFHFSAGDLETFVEHILGDFAADVGVSQIRKKPDRAKYLKSTPQPDSKNRQKKAKSLTTSTVAKAKPKPKRKRASKPPKPFKDLDLSKLGERTDNVLREFQGIDVDLYPNAAALLTRAILELAVDEFIAKKKLSTEGKLKKRIQRTLNIVDSTGKDRQFQGVRQGLSDSTSLYAVATLHGFVHNPHFHPDGSGIRSIAANLNPFLQALNDHV
jgi:hypothetical protein